MVLHQCALSSSFHVPFKHTMGSPTRVFTANGEETETVVPKEAGIDPGSHDELMYSLGVNLARYVSSSSRC